jgi:hypothetical protein
MNTVINPLTPELNPSAQRCLPRFLLGILIFKGLTARRLCKSFSFKRLTNRFRETRGIFCLAEKELRCTELEILQGVIPSVTRAFGLRWLRVSRQTISQFEALSEYLRHHTIKLGKANKKFTYFLLHFIKTL